jgi:pimeloyl-ACP methyl ester carboxylesterase
MVSLMQRWPPPPHSGFVAGLSFVILALLLAGCKAPIGANRVSPREAYKQVAANSLHTSTPSSDTMSVLHRYGLSELAKERPDEAVVRLHEKAVASQDRTLWFALAELSYAAGNQIRRSVQPWDPRDARDFYLGAAVYAYWFIFGETNTVHTPAEAFDRRFRTACDLYNYALGLALMERRGTNGIVILDDAKRRLPVGEIDWAFSQQNFSSPLEDFEKFLLADEFRVHGFSVRNRVGGIGAPLIAVGKVEESLRLYRCTPATIFLRLRGSLGDLAGGRTAASLELHSTYEEPSVTVGNVTVPLEADLTAPRAYTLNQSFVWRADKLQFLSPDLGLKSQLILTEPYAPGRIPVIFVHGTFSSPVWWGEMFNTLEADPEIRKRFQVWMYLYSSSQPIVISAAELRDAITNKIYALDPKDQDPALQQMVVIGHSQGGLLTKLTATHTGDQLWHAFNTNRLEDLPLSEEQRASIRRLSVFEPLPSVKRVVFISTPHRGSFKASVLVANLIRRLVTLPRKIAREGTDLMKLTESSNLPKEMRRKTLTSLDGMSPRNPVALKVADLPVAPGIKAHSIIAIQTSGDYHKGNDGIVKYTSAHVDYVESEFIVHSFHSCQDKPETIEEVRRILHEHLNSSRQLEPN